MTPLLLWFRQDLRLEDNPALAAALVRGGPVIPVVIEDEEAEGRWRPGTAATAWWQASVAALDSDLRSMGSRLVRRRGDTSSELQRLLAETGAGAVYWNRRYEPALVARDRQLAGELLAQGLDVQSFNAALLHEPDEIRNREGGAFQVFTPYWRACLAEPVAAPWKRGARKLPVPAQWPPAGEFAAAPSTRPGEAALLRGRWIAGEREAQRRLDEFVQTALTDYAETRDYPALEGTSRLSPWLHVGAIGPRQVWAAVAKQGAASGVFPASSGARVFLTEIGWREFAHQLLFHFPATAEAPLRREFAAFPWAADPGDRKLDAWRQGRTGYPIVDAGMRQLAQTGWMHNRVRMVVASFLVKHLRLPWQLGAAHFWETLVDADLANNTLGWQWSAGCGADAAPYFRIFAPVLQGEKFDPDGAYLRAWIPELARVPAKFIQAPWEAPDETLREAGVTLGRDYPRPIVDHAEARLAALAAFQEMRRITARKGL